MCRRTAVKVPGISRYDGGGVEDEALPVLSLLLRHSEAYVHQQAATYEEVRFVCGFWESVLTRLNEKTVFFIKIHVGMYLGIYLSTTLETENSKNLNFVVCYGETKHKNIST